MFQVKAHRIKAGRMETSHYKVTISRFRARLLVRINYNTLKGEAIIEGYPDVSNYIITIFFFFLNNLQITLPWK